MTWSTKLRLCGLLIALSSGCENKCDELVTVLTDCVSGGVGATEETTETQAPATDAECSGDDAACATCVLESKLDLCIDYGTALAQCRASGECVSE